MPNITIYLNDDLFMKFKELSDEKKTELRYKFIAQLVILEKVMKNDSK